MWKAFVAFYSSIWILGLVSHLTDPFHILQMSCIIVQIRYPEILPILQCTDYVELKTKFILYHSFECRHPSFVCDAYPYLLWFQYFLFLSQCRIMRDMKNVNAKGNAKSLGFGFVNFAEHKHALEALRHLNNNSEIFGDEKVSIFNCIFSNFFQLLFKTL